MDAVLGDRRVVGLAGRALADGLDVGVVDGLVGVLAQAGAAADEPDRGAVDDRELALQAGVDVGLAAEVDDERRDVQAQRGDVAGRDAVLVVQLDARVDRRVVDDPARERLVRVDVQLPRRAEAVGDLAQVVLGGGHRRPAARALDAVDAAREALLRQQRGGVAVLRGAARVQRLAHRAELLAHARGLGPGEADRPDHLLLRSSPSSVPIAIAAPNTPTLPVLCQPAV